MTLNGSKQQQTFKNAFFKVLYKWQPKGELLGEGKREPINLKLIADGLLFSLYTPLLIPST